MCRWISEDAAAAGQGAGNSPASQCPLLPMCCPLVLQGDGEPLTQAGSDQPEVKMGAGCCVPSKRALFRLN